MIPKIRAAFNAQFTNERYANYLTILNEQFKDQIPFRIAETPVFVDKVYKQSMLEAGDYICQFITDPSFTSKTNQAIPANLHVPNEQPLPACLVIDFAIAKGKDGRFLPQLIELQGFPSLFAFEILQSNAIEKAYTIPNGFTPFLNGYNANSYLEFLSTTIKGNNELHTILLEIKPYEQKTIITIQKPVCGFFHLDCGVAGPGCAQTQHSHHRFRYKRVYGSQSKSVYPIYHQ